MRWLRPRHEFDGRKLINGGLRKSSWNIWRWLFGRYTLEDPSPAAQKSPYTFFLPSKRELENVQPGDSVKLDFRGSPQSEVWETERMWVTVTSVSPEGMKGELDNIPSDIPQMSPGDIIRFQPFHIIATNKDVPGEPEQRYYWERCLVDKCVTEDRVPVHYLYREEPDMAGPEDKFPDSGWRIRGDYRSLTDEQLDAREKQYIALGAVLNRDDSWLHLIDAPVGSRFIRDWDSGAFVPLTD